MTTEFVTSIHDQFQRSITAGVTDFECNIPVVSTATNRMTVGMPAKSLPKVPHTISLRRHPAGFIRVAVESAYGMACPDPLAQEACDAVELPLDVTTTGPDIRRHQGLLIVSRPQDLEMLGAGFDGTFSRLHLNDEAQRTFAAQVAGAALKRTLISEQAA